MTDICLSVRPFAFGPLVLLLFLLPMAVTIPIGTTATVVLPTSDLSAATESGKPLAEAEGVQRIDSSTHAAGESRLAVESGRYHFETQILP